MNEANARIGSSLPDLAGLLAWYGTLPGQALGEAEETITSDILPNLFGYHLVQIGDSARDLTTTSRISYRLVIGLNAAAGQGISVVARADALPVQANAIDVVMLPHTLEFAPNPHGVLREAERILIGEGHLLILGFNPWSFFGLYRRALNWRGDAPWSGHFLSLSRLKDWLGLLGFDIERVLRASFRPPIASPRWHQRLAFLERLGAHFWPMTSNVYGVLARKRVLSARPLRTAWKVRRRFPAGSVVEPTTRQPIPQKPHEEGHPR